MRFIRLLMLVFLVFSASPVLAAKISGTLYDIELNELPDVIVEVNTAPKQLLVAKNATYAFNVPKGTYEITARHEKQALGATEQITVAEEGSYVLDLILFPDLGEEEELLNETAGIQIEEAYVEPPLPFPWHWLAVIIIGVLLIAWSYFMKGNKKPEVPKKETKKPELEDLLAIIKKEGGRITQKDLRKQMPYSEGKISLMLAELESQGKIKKIKRGRGNIIILQ